jgi:peptidoglycan hydrolase-like protein with peptidoglycan-binding domain
MSDRFVTARAFLRPDPDESSQELVAIETDEKVALLGELASWAKVSFVDKAGRPHIGWMLLTLLKEAKPSTLKLYDAPFGTGSNVVGEIVAELAQLPPWRKVLVRSADGSQTRGWLNSEDADGPPVIRESRSAEGPASGDDLILGPNEVYRPSLIRAQQITDINAAALAALINAEAAKLPNGQWNPNSRAGTSSAAGLTQFLDATWRAHAARKDTLLNQVAKAKGYVTAAGDIAAGKDDDLLDLRFDPELSIVSAAEHGLSNLQKLIDDELVDEQLGDDEKARFIYLAHHEGLGGARSFLRRTDSHTFSDLKTQVGGSRAQQYIDAAGGDTTQAYRNWLDEYMDDKIQPSKFRKSGTESSGGHGTKALSEFDGPPVPFADLGGRRELVKAVQWRLWELGYLDPPADGIFGPVSHWALSEFCAINQLSTSAGFTKEVARRLLSPSVSLPEIAATGTWFDKVLDYMKRQGYFICRHWDCKNIVYLEGVNADGSLNNDAPNVFNDVRIVFSVAKDGRPRFEDSLWESTTEPGDHWTIRPMNPKGAARIAFNQYKAWSVGTHRASSPQGHEALVQTAPVAVYRDLNKDFKRPGDRIDTGLFGINQHWGYDAPTGDLGTTSAGCLVGRTRNGHRQFMALVKQDPRYKVSTGYRFVTAIMPGDKVLG